jgi:hypothetical protein
MRFKLALATFLVVLVSGTLVASVAADPPTRARVSALME